MCLEHPTTRKLQFTDRIKKYFLTDFTLNKLLAEKTANNLNQTVKK
jgi:hypothetical protein